MGDSVQSIADLPVADMGGNGWPAPGGGNGPSLPSSAPAVPVMAVAAPGDGSITQSPQGFEGSLHPIDNSRFRAQMLKRGLLYSEAGEPVSEDPAESGGDASPASGANVPAHPEAEADRGAAGSAPHAKS